LREYSPCAFGTWEIFPQLWEISLTIDLGASHYLDNMIRVFNILQTNNSVYTNEKIYAYD